MFLILACVFSLKIFLNKQPNPRKKLLVPCALDPPNSSCYVCASKPEVTVRLNVHTVTVLTLQDKASARTSCVFFLSRGWNSPFNTRFLPGSPGCRASRTVPDGFAIQIPSGLFRQWFQDMCLVLERCGCACLEDDAWFCW